MPDILAIYAAVGGSAGLIGVGWQIYSKHTEEADRVRFELGRSIQSPVRWPGNGERLPFAEWMNRYWHPGGEPGTAMAVTNLGHHPLHVALYGIDQDATDGDCVRFGPIEIPPRRTYRDIWFGDWCAEGDCGGMDLHQFPVRGFIILDDGTTLYSPPKRLYSTV